jgi:hypothetical protein
LLSLRASTEGGGEATISHPAPVRFMFQLAQFILKLLQLTHKASLAKFQTLCWFGISFAAFTTVAIYCEVSSGSLMGLRPEKAISGENAEPNQSTGWRTFGEAKENYVQAEVIFVELRKQKHSFGEPK